MVWHMISYEFYHEATQKPLCSVLHNICPVGYRPVILMHGILDNYESLDQLVAFIQDAHPGTTVYNIDAYNDLVGLAAASLSQI